MREHIKGFFLRGLTVSVGGPLVLAVVYWIIGMGENAAPINQNEIALGIVTSAILAFIAGGITEIYRVERLPGFFAALIHGVVLYIDYAAVYCINGWFKDGMKSFIVFTVVFAAGYLLIWLGIYLSGRRAVLAMNKKLKN